MDECNVYAEYRTMLFVNTKVTLQYIKNEIRSLEIQVDAGTTLTLHTKGDTNILEEIYTLLRECTIERGNV